MNLDKRQEKWLLNEKYGGLECKSFFSDLEKLKKGFPVDFLIGNRPFLNCKIDLSLKPLIPRDETEFLILEIIKEISDKKNNVLDIFSGSGCIGVAILKNCSGSRVDFGEINKQYLKQIEINLKNNIKNFEKKSNIIHSNVFSKITKKYDLIIANPPYIPDDQKTNVQKSVLKFEDHNALFAKEEGLYFIKKIIKEGFDYLNKNGFLYMEFDSEQKEKIEELLLINNKYSSFDFIKDCFGKFRFVKIIK